MNRIIIIIIILSSIISCTKEDNNIPAYIKIDNITLNDNSTHKITDAWVYIDDNLQGVYELPANFPLAVYLHFGHPGHGACCEVLDLRRASVLQSIAPQLRKLGSFFVVLIVVIFAFASYECAWRDTRCVLQPPLTFVNIRSWPLVVPDVSFGFNFIETRTLMTSMMEQTTASLVGTRWEPRVLLSGVVRLAHAATVPRVAHSASPISTVCKELHRSWDPCLSSFSRSS
mgnify:CR=1 FL=1